ncbi:MAG: hypothetical protein ACXAB7_16735 [Candidatus Kariarchaeaceae archaeon]
MISDSLRAWNLQQGFSPSLFLFQSTSVGVFNISNVESEIRTEFEAIELLCLSTIKEFEKCTRIEIHALSGLSIELCDEQLDQLYSASLIDLTSYDPDQMQKNIDRLIIGIGEDWISPQIREIITRKIVKQYQLTALGLSLLESQVKITEQSTHLNLILTASPFCVFSEKIKLRHNGFEDLSVSPEQTYRVLQLAKKYAKKSGIIPKSISSNSIINGREVVNAQFWVSIGFQSAKSNSIRHRFHLTSIAFERWANPPIDESILAHLPEFDGIDSLVRIALSNSYNMVEDVIYEALRLEPNQITWILKCDLEMLMLINKVNPAPVQEIRTEINLNLKKSPWRLAFIMQLEEYDELAFDGLKAARFHANANRGGFGLDKGFQTWSRMMNQWDKKNNYADYLKTLALLVKHDCLLEIKPEIQSIVVDVEGLLSYQRRERQQWTFKRLRQVDSILRSLQVESVRYLAPSIIAGKIDDEDTVQQWITEGKLEIFEDPDSDVHPVIQRAFELDAHYLGNRKLPSGDKFKEMRIYSRKLHFFMKQKEVKIPNAEPFYEWKVGDVLTSMYNEYYE